jgi:DASH complex subunit DAD3
MADHRPSGLSSSLLPTDGPGAEDLTELESELLDEYGKLLGTLNNASVLLTDQGIANAMQLSDILAELANNPTPAILDSLRGLERKTSLVFTLLKASVYRIVLKEQIDQGGGDEDASVGGA